jgi:phosphoglycolate phosphatase
VREKLGSSATLFSAFNCAASIFRKPTKFRRVLERARVKPPQAIAIGDETRDIESARALGIACGAVTRGYAAPQALIDRRPDLVFDGWRILRAISLQCALPTRRYRPPGVSHP